MLGELGLDTHVYVDADDFEGLAAAVGYLGTPILNVTTRQTQGTVYFNTSTKLVTMHPADKSLLLRQRDPVYGFPVMELFR